VNLPTAGRLKGLFSISFVVAAGLWSTIVPTNAQVNVTQFHNHASEGEISNGKAHGQAQMCG
jgi:hypothetical protein